MPRQSHFSRFNPHTIVGEEYRSLSSRGQRTMGGPPAWRLGEGLTIRHKNVYLLRNVRR
jgi:hypothetical protein